MDTQKKTNGVENMFYVTEQFKNIYGKMQFRTILTTTDLNEAKACLTAYDGTNEIEITNSITAEIIEKKIPMTNENNLK